jgi:hypothetical protein
MVARANVFLLLTSLLWLRSGGVCLQYRYPDMATRGKYREK